MIRMSFIAAAFALMTSVVCGIAGHDRSAAQPPTVHFGERLAQSSAKSPSEKEPPPPPPDPKPKNDPPKPDEPVTKPVKPEPKRDK